MPPVAWQPWHTAAFLDAQRRQRPVLLLLEAEWAPACARLHVDVFAREDVQAAMAETVVPVRVDVDRRPDIADRYGLGHWPTVLLLTPEGLVITGGTDIDASLADRLRQVARAARDIALRDTRAEDASARHHPGPVNAALDEASALTTRADDSHLAAIAAEVWSIRDSHTNVLVHHDAPSADALLFALSHAMVAGDQTWMAAAVDTAHALAARVDVPPARLEDAADAVRALARMVHADPGSRWRDALRHSVRALVAFRRDDGHWRPWSTATDLVLVDAAARACAALDAAAVALEDPSMAGNAVEAIEVLAPAAYARGSGVAHVLDARGAAGPMLLVDAMALSAALLGLDAWRDDGVYRDLADEIVQTTTVRLREPGGLYTDRVASMAGAGRVGRLALPHHPLDGNALAARLRLYLAPDDPAAQAAARATLRGLAAFVPGAGAHAAPIGLAWHALRPTGGVMGVW